MLRELGINEPFDAYYGGTILIPEGCLFYRGYDTAYPPIANRTTHFGTREVASGYAARTGHSLGAFVTTRPIRVFDLRYLHVLLKQAFSQRANNKMEALDPLVRVSVGYGLCSFVDQLVYARRMFQNSTGVAAMESYFSTFIENKEITGLPLDMYPMTPQGIRIAETMNDGYICAFLKEMIAGKADGFIAPPCNTVYHVEKGGKMSGELVLFDPIASGIAMLPSGAVSQRVTVSMNQLLDMQSQRVSMCSKDGFQASYREKKGGRKKSIRGGTDDAYDPNGFLHQLQANHPDALALEKQAKHAATVWKKRVAFVDWYAPHPETPVSPWWKEG